MNFSRDLILVVAGRLSVALIALASIRIATSFLPPEEYGALALLIAYQMFCGLFLINPVGQHINRHTHKWWDDGTLLMRLKGYRWYVMLVSMIGCILILIFGSGSSKYDLVIASLALFMMVMSATWNATLIPMLNMLGYREASVGWAVMTALSGLLFSVFLMGWRPDALGWFVGQAAGQMVGAIGAARKLNAINNAGLYKQGTGKVALIDMRTVKSFCLPLAIATIFMWVQLSGYRFFIEFYWGMEQLGFAAVGLMLASQIGSLLESILVQLFYPMFYRRITVGDASSSELAFSDLLNILAPIFFVITGIIVLSAPYLLKVMADARYSEAVVFVMLGGFIECGRILGNVLSNAAQVTRKTSSLAVPYAVGALAVAVCIAISGSMGLDIVWSGISLVIGSLLMLWQMLLKMKEQVSFQLDYVRWLAGFFLMLVLSLTGLLMSGDVDVFGAFARLLFAALVGVLLIGLLSWNNPALSRVLAVKLREGQ